MLSLAIACACARRRPTLGGHIPDCYFGSRYLDLWPCGPEDRLHLERLLGWKPPAMVLPAAAAAPSLAPSPNQAPMQALPQPLQAQIVFNTLPP